MEDRSRRQARNPAELYGLADVTPEVISRREVIRRGGAVAAAATVFPTDFAERLAQISSQDDVIPWTNAPPAGGRANTLDWQALDSWVTPTEQLFSVGHYGTPELDGEAWRLEITGMVDRPMTLTLDDIQSRPQQDVTMLLECAGNRGFATFMGAVHNAKWTGTPLCTSSSRGRNSRRWGRDCFFGADTGTETLLHRDDIEVDQQFARSLSVEDAMRDNVLLAWAVNGEFCQSVMGIL